MIKENVVCFYSILSFLCMNEHDKLFNELHFLFQAAALQATDGPACVPGFQPDQLTLNVHTERLRTHRRLGKGKSGFLGRLLMHTPLSIMPDDFQLAV